MYMEDIKIFTKSEKELENLIQIVRIYSQDMKFRIEKSAMLIMKKRNETTKQ